ncbi:hypothetical protein DY000_02002242 [Brassica cretica]|uniref:Uncharacterized protein n=1 Tax=Brassica cretica TaxID=69181 RepID=A0ABQ7C0Z7_BRACR|nr:hypothetical protein DY000_02002242 [Brassica cretica]
MEKHSVLRTLVMVAAVVYWFNSSTSDLQSLIKLTRLKASLLICCNATVSASLGVFVGLIEEDPCRCRVPSLMYKEQPTPATSLSSFQEASTWQKH